MNGPTTAGAGAPDPHVGDGTGMVRIRDVEGAEPGDEGTAGVQRTSRFAEERAALETTWTASLIFEPEELSEYARISIYNDAMRAVKFGQSVDDACPHPWFTPSGKLWRTVHRKAMEAKNA